MSDKTIEQEQLRKLKLENKKLELDIKELETRGSFEKWVTKLLPIVPIVLAIAAFLFGIYQFREQQDSASAQRKIQEDAVLAQREKDRIQNKLETIKPILDKQYGLYFEVSTQATEIVNSPNDAVRAKAEAEFWRLSKSQLVILAEDDVKKAVDDFGECLKQKCDGEQLSAKNLSLSETIRKSIQLTYGISF